MTLTRFGILVFSATALTGLLLGALIGASVAFAYMADQAAECQALRAESYALNAETYEAAILEHKQVGEWICAARGVCR